MAGELARSFVGLTIVLRTWPQTLGRKSPRKMLFSGQNVIDVANWQKVPVDSMPGLRHNPVNVGQTTRSQRDAVRRPDLKILEQVGSLQGLW